MPAAIIRSGHGAGVAFTTSAFVASFRSIGSFTLSREELDTSHLKTVDYMTFDPGDLVNPGEWTGEFLYNADVQPPFLGAKETITITLPGPGASWAGGATIAGSGFIKEFTTPELVTNQIMMASFVVKWSGTITWTDQV
jgi:hypothetical protein